MTEPSYRFLWFDGESLSLEEVPGARRFGADPRPFEASEPVRGAWAHVCALPDDSARVPYDEPEVQGARAAALAWWIPLLGDSLVCLTTLSLDSVGYGGAITVARDPDRFRADPFARIFPGTLVRTDLFGEVDAPPGPVIERYAGAPWPAGSFASR
ncbi:MAG: hypothetical protein AVDCRST_MAG17-2093 [uncultured Solirubrobacterales bacterium]|uniref:Uncharacterized protein n=1 Tax=uncultured Solirubrobacterales bacterium TaxID=768556 RepID=A0A6J4T415_9ACTN|nr:MAG: hypothetical protein AVDCRST_MAG17-2093 [uncultured Solirubrobacterales bacterium]